MSAADPFVMILLKELPAVLALPRRELVVWIAVRALARNGWAIRRQDVQRLTGLSERHTKLALAALDRGGYLSRDYCGARSDPWGMMRCETRIPEILVTRIPEIPSQDPRDPEPGSQRSRPSLHQISRSPDLTCTVRPKTDQVAREGAARTDGRTEGELERTAAELWPRCSRRIRGQALARLRDVAAEFDDAELASYLRWAAADPTLELARGPLGAACTAERFETWLAARARARRPARAERPPDSSPLLTPRELAELAERARSEL